MELIVKILLCTLIWILIIFNFYILVNSRKYFQKLKMLEKSCIKRRKDFVHSYVPVLYSIQKHSQNVNLALKTNSLKEFLYSVPDIAKGISECQNLGIKTGINLIKWFLE